MWLSNVLLGHAGAVSWPLGLNRASMCLNLDKTDLRLFGLQCHLHIGNIQLNLIYILPIVRPSVLPQGGLEKLRCTQIQSKF